MIDCARSAFRFRIVLFSAMGVLLAACGDGSSSSSMDSQAAGLNQTPDIQGTPVATLKAGEAWEFKPTATDPDKDALTFTVSNKPAWASFDSQTGRLWGTPADQDAGKYDAIAVAATDGKASDVLTFALTVQASAKGATNVTLAWIPPTENEDGTALTDLAGYRIHYGNASGSYSETVTLDNPGITRFVVENLTPGTYYFSITALAHNGEESNFSLEGEATVS